MCEHTTMTSGVSVQSQCAVAPTMEPARTGWCGVRKQAMPCVGSTSSDLTLPDEPYEAVLLPGVRGFALAAGAARPAPNSTARMATANANPARRPFDVP